MGTVLPSRIHSGVRPVPMLVPSLLVAQLPATGPSWAAALVAFGFL
jgi:hypothetical protein